jgi:hypothetical protein
LKVLRGVVEEEGVKELTGKLGDLVSVEYLLSLMNHTLRPYQALCLAKLVMLRPLMERAFEEAFSCFTEQLSQASLSPGVVELAEEIAERLSSSQLGQLNSVLGRQPREEGVEHKLDALRLKEAYLLLRERDIEAALSLVSTLHNTPHLEEEVLKFYEEADWGSGRVLILKHKLSTSVEVLSQESPSAAATIRILCQLFDTELLSLRTEAQESLANLRAEGGAVYEAAARTASESAARMQRLEEQSERKELAYQESLASLKGELETLNRELTEAVRLLQCTRAEAAQDQLPTFIYSYSQTTDQLYETSLVTGETSCHRLTSYTFKEYCCWSELPGWSLLITGGESPVSREVVKIDTRTFAVSEQPPMLSARSCHAAVYHAQCLYILGGWSGSSCLSECERFVCAESRWETLPPLPTACYDISGVVVEGSLYALGGQDIYGDYLDLIQKLNLEGLTWEPLHLSLPQTGGCIASFKLSDSEVYFVLHKTLYSLHTLRPVKTLSEGSESWFGPSYYSRGGLYCSNNDGAAERLEIGSLN